jgi:hypothetical protein
MLLAMCNASESSKFFTGEQVFDRFQHTEFYGSSGLVKFYSTGTRDYSTVRWAVWNVRHNGSNTNDDNASLTFVPAFRYQGDLSVKWVHQEPFIFANGGTVPPSSLPPTDTQNNYIGTTGRAVGYTFMCIALVSSVLSLVWLCYYRNAYVIISSQPLFLLMISIGTFVMAITILPLGFDELVIDNETALSRACMSVPWLYVGGASFPLSAMFAKIRGVHKVRTGHLFVCSRRSSVRVG